MKILDRYVTRLFLSTYGVVLLFVLGIFVVINVFSMIDSLLEAREVLHAHGLSPAGVLARYYVVSLPFLVIQLAPFTTVIAATIAMIRLIRGNEHLPMITAGRSPARITLPILLVAAGISAGMLVLQEWGVPRLAGPRIRLEQVAKGNFDIQVERIPFLIDGAGNSWRIDTYLPARRTIRRVVVLRFKDPETGELRGSYDIPSAAWRDAGPAGPGWYPEGGLFLPVTPEGDPENPVAVDRDRPLPTDLTPAELEVVAAGASRQARKMLSLSEAARLARLHPDFPRQTVALHSLITWPVSNVLLLLLVLPFIFRLGERNLFVGVGIALVIAASYFVLDTLCQDLGARAVLNPAVAPWLPVVFYGSLAAAIHEAGRG